MAVVGFPPPCGTVDSTRIRKVALSAGTTLVRVYDPKSKHKPGARLFRSYGPLRRFDHHRGRVGVGPSTPDEDTDRSVYYASLTLSGSVVEVFGEDRVIERGSFRAAYSRLLQPLSLLDLRGDAAIRAGTLHALGQIEATSKTQAWSRYFYETPATYGLVDGLIYANSHNGEDAILLYERAAHVIASAKQTVRLLANPGMELQLLRIADATGFILV